jgi:hypothetical protein
VSLREDWRLVTENGEVARELASTGRWLRAAEEADYSHESGTSGGACRERGLGAPAGLSCPHFPTCQLHRGTSSRINTTMPSTPTSAERYLKISRLIVHLTNFSDIRARITIDKLRL